MKFIKFLTIVLCASLTFGCGAEEKEKEKEELPTNITETIVIDDENAAAVCSSNLDYSDTGGYVTGSKMAIFVDENNIVTKVVSREIAVSNNPETLEILQEAFERQYSSFSQYGGYEYNIKIEGNQFISDVTIDYTEADLKSMATDNEDLKVYLNDKYQFTLDTLKSMYVSVGAECK